MKLTKKAFREVLNKRHQEKVEREQKRLHALPKDFVQREMDRIMGNGVYHARKRKQGDYLYAQDPEMFNHLFKEWKEEEIKKGCGELFEQEDDVGMTMCGKRPLCPKCQIKLDAVEKKGDGGAE